MSGKREINSITLTVKDLENQLRFYCDALGMMVHHREHRLALLGPVGGSSLVILHEDPSARTRVVSGAGLFHLALLLPGRKELANTLFQLHQAHWPIEGAADHGVSEAVYLSDAEGNGIELYVDKPSSAWPRKGRDLAMTTAPFDLQELLKEASISSARGTSISSRTKVGHIHLQVTNLHRSEQFYRNVLGFEVTQRSFAGALFFAAQQYHHHIGANVWRSRAGSPLTPGTIGLQRFLVAYESTEEKHRSVHALMNAGIPLQREGENVITHDFDNIEIELQ